MRCPHCHEENPAWRAVLLNVRGGFPCRMCGNHSYVDIPQFRRESTVPKQVVTMLLVLLLAVIAFVFSLSNIAILIMASVVFCVWNVWMFRNVEMLPAPPPLWHERRRKARIATGFFLIFFALFVTDLLNRSEILRLIGMACMGAGVLFMIQSSSLRMKAGHTDEPEAHLGEDR